MVNGAGTVNSRTDSSDVVAVSDEASQ